MAGELPSAGGVVASVMRESRDGASEAQQLADLGPFERLGRADDSAEFLDAAARVGLNHAGFGKKSEVTPQCDQAPIHCIDGVPSVLSEMPAEVGDVPWRDSGVVVSLSIGGLEPNDELLEVLAERPHRSGGIVVYVEKPLEGGVIWSGHQWRLHLTQRYLDSIHANM